MLAPWSGLGRSDYRRLARIVRTLRRTPAVSLLRFVGIIPSPPDAVIDAAELGDAVVAALQELGPTFVKIGQILASRTDLLPMEIIERLEKLHDDADPAPYEDVRQQLAADLGGDPHKLFRSFSQVPIAAASIAQVYAAKLQSGEDVVVKVRRPGVDDVMRADLRLLMAAARIAERRVPRLRRHQPTQVIGQLGSALLEEIDLRREARNQQELKRNAHPFHVPRVYEQFTSERTLVSERIRGQPAGSSLAARAPSAAKELAQIAARGLLRMILMNGVFHADPHPGNVMVMPDGGLALLDFGSVGRLTDRRREQVLIVLGSLVDVDAGAVAEVLMDWAGRRESPPPALEQAVERFLSKYAAESGEPIRLAEAVGAFVEIARANDLSLPPDLILLMRTLGIAEGLARTLDPDIDVVAAIAPVVMRAFAARYRPKMVAKRGIRALKELDQAAAIAPTALRRVMARLAQQGLTARVEVGGLDGLASDIRRGARAIALALVAAAVILAAALLAASSHLR